MKQLYTRSSIKYLISVLFMFFLILNINASQPKKLFGNIDWQFNIPIGNDFANKASGWGLDFEGGYFIKPVIGIGVFFSYSTNHSSIGEKTLELNDNSALTTNQQRSLFQMPFGVSFRYKLINNYSIEPYWSLRLGTEFCRMSTYISSYKIYEKIWGFYLSPEIGTNLWITKSFGVNFSVYYNFSTCKGKVLDGEIDNLSNLGIKVGLAF